MYLLLLKLQAALGVGILLDGSGGRGGGGIALRGTLPLHQLDGCLRNDRTGR